jgi:hypothetical protein
MASPADTTTGGNKIQHHPLSAGDRGDNTRHDTPTKGRTQVCGGTTTHCSVWTAPIR